jgi:release factor glutamine methyltransferase
MHGIPDSNLEAEVLLRHALQYDRANFYASLREQLSSGKLEIVKNLVNRRTQGEPLAYITQHKEFYGLDFCVTPAVLIPRQETELLVDEALKFATTKGEGNISVADVGTGSGAIAISIAVNLPHAKVYATDCSGEALEIADFNRRKHEVADRITILKGDLLAPMPQPVDLIISNPPYISSDLLPGLAPEVRREPRTALDGGKEGLEVISRLLEQAPARLNAGGSMLVEISPEQTTAVSEMAMAQFPIADISYANDLMDLPRCIHVSTK